MLFEIVQKPSFYNDVWPLPQHVQKRISEACRRIQEDPFRAGGNSKRILKRYYRNLYRFRIGDYRLIYAVGNRCVSFLAIRHRNDLYENFRVGEEDLQAGPVDAASAEPQVIPTTSYETADLMLPVDDVDDVSYDEVEDDVAGGPPEKTPQLLAELLDFWKV